MNNPHFPLSDPETGTAKRGKNRDSLFLKAHVRFPASGEENEVRVRNLSSGGLMAEAPLRSPRGEIVEVQLKNIGWVSGKVAWVAESRFGIAFDYPIDPKLATVRASSGYKIPRYLEKLNQTETGKKLRPL